MPEFERKKRKSLSDQQLFDEYYGVDKKKPVKSSSKVNERGTTQGKGRGKSKPAKRENPPISPERQRIKDRYPEENAVSTYPDKKKKASAVKKGSVSAKRKKLAVKCKNCKLLREKQEKKTATRKLCFILFSMRNSGGSGSYRFVGDGAF